MAQTRRRFLFWIGHLAAWALAVTMVLSLPVAIAARDFGAVVFSRQRVQSILQSQLVQSGALNQILLKSLIGEGGIGTKDEWFRRVTEHLSDPERQEVLALLLPPGWVAEQISTATDSVFAWFESEDTVPELFLDMQPIKAQLLGDSLDQVVEVFIDSWPSCSPEQVEKLQKTLDQGGDLPSFVCEPPEPLRGYIVELTTRGLAIETGDIPGRLPLIGRDTVDLRELEGIKRSLRSSQVMLAWTWLVPISLLGPIMALKIRSMGDLGRWWGLPLFFAGVATFLFNLLLRGTQTSFFNEILHDLGPPGSAQYEIVDLLIQGAASQALRLMILHSFILAIIGALVWYFLTYRRTVPKVVESEISPSQVREVDGDPGSTPVVGMDVPPAVPPIDDGVVEDEDGPPSGIFG